MANKVRTFLVGGAVRDHVMGVRAKDQDYVVTGMSHEDMLASNMFGRSFRHVGQHFPIYLDQDDSEWALARRERKSGKGYKGFDFETGRDVSIEEDLMRRDLTINAMAIEVFDDMKTRPIDITDPYGGRRDVEAKVLRHVSDAFEEDPVRVLRVARLRARFGPEWTVAPETQKMMHTMAKKGVLDELTKERVWKELSRAMMETHPRLFFDTLLETDTLKAIFPEIYRLKGALEHRLHHPEGDAYEHTMLVLQKAVEYGFDLETRMAALTHDFGKGVTSRDLMPSHVGHEKAGVPIVGEFARRVALPRHIRKTCEMTCRYHMKLHYLPVMKPASLGKLLNNLGALRGDQDVDALVRLGTCDARGRLGRENADVSHLEMLPVMADAWRSVQSSDVFPSGFPENPIAIQQGLHKARVEALKLKLDEYRSTDENLPQPA